MFTFNAKFLRIAEDTLNGLTVMSLEEFLKQGSRHTAADEDKSENTKKPDNDSSELLGIKHREPSDEEMQDYLDRVKNKEKTRHDMHTMPYVHGSNVKIVNDNGKEYDLAALKIQIMKRPASILKQNEKMRHSDGTSTQYYNIGLPALKGLAVNEKTGKFVIVDTCPGAGICKTFCYALKGNYVQFKATSMYQSQVLNFLLNNPNKFKARLKAEIGLALADADDGTKISIRWHDAGDFFSPEYLSLAFEVANSFPDVDFYAYTKISAAANAKKPNNFIMNFSEGALPSQSKNVDLTKVKHSVVVPQKMFWDLINTHKSHTVKNKDTGQVEFKSPEAWDEFKNRLVSTYKIPKNTIIIYDQYMDMKRNDQLGNKENYWNVVVPPGGGDNSANDTLVQGTYLMWH